MRLLLVEDDRALCGVLEPVLTGAGYTVTACHTGAAGLDKLLGEGWDVCVLDRLLPAPDGLTVADRGPGIPDADKEKIFDRFARGDAARTDRAHFGLGLSVAKELAALHGAKLRVTDPPGGGAAFTLELKA